MAQELCGTIRFNVGDSYCVTFAEAAQAIAGAETLDVKCAAMKSDTDRAAELLLTPNCMLNATSYFLTTTINGLSFSALLWTTNAFAVVLALSLRAR